MARDYIASLPAAVFPNMVGLADEFAFADADERFELLIDIFADGLARRARALTDDIETSGLFVP